MQTVVMKGRNEEAKAVLQRLHDDNRDHLFWEQEYLQISAQVQLEMEEKKQASWTHLWSNKSELKRTFLAICAMTSTQTSGATTVQVFQVRPSFRGQYKPNALYSVFYGGLGFDSRKILLMAIVFQICLLAGGILNISTIDWFGRKFLFPTGLGTMTVVLGMFAAFSERFTTTGESGECARLCRQSIADDRFSLGQCRRSNGHDIHFHVWRDLSLHPLCIRGRGSSDQDSLSGHEHRLICRDEITVCFTQTAPIALQHIGWRFDIVFIACNIFFFVIFWILCPEVSSVLTSSYTTWCRLELITTSDRLKA